MLLADEMKWIAGAGIALCLIFSGYKLYNLGYENAMGNVAKDQKIATDKAIEAAKIEWEKSRTITQEGMNNVRENTQKIVYLERQAPSIAAPKCTDLGTDYGKLYNSAIDTIQGHANSSGNGIDAKVPSRFADENANR